MKRFVTWVLPGAAALIIALLLLLSTRVSGDSVAVVDSGRPGETPTVLMPGFHLRPVGSSVTHYSTLPVTATGKAQAITAGGGELILDYQVTCALDPNGFARQHFRLVGGSLETLCTDDVTRFSREQVSLDQSAALLTGSFLSRMAEAVSDAMTRTGYSEASVTFMEPDEDVLLAAAMSLAPRGEGVRLQEVVSAAVDSPNGTRSWKLLTAMGFVNESGRDLLAAEKNYIDAVAIEPAALPPMSQLVSLYSTVGEWRKLARVLDAALAAAPESLQHINWLAMTFLRLEDYLAAEEILVQGLTFLPDSSTMLSNLGGIYLKTGRTEEALDYLRRAVDAEPTNPQALFNLGAALAAEARYEEALPRLEAAEQVGTGSYQLFRTLAIVHEELGSPEKATPYRDRMRGMEAEQALRRPPGAG